ncbi:DNA-methyltransferase [Candidatus Nitrospira bockiana]
MVHTDPPYGVSYQAPSGKHKPIRNDHLRDDDLVKRILIPALRLAVRHTLSTAAFYIWHASSTREDFAYAMKAVGLVEKQYIIWDKGQFVLGHADYQWAHEPCFYAGKDGEQTAFYGDRSQATIWNISATTEKAVITAIGKGLQLVDGAGGRLTVLPRNKTKNKLRVIRLETGQILQLAESGAQSTVWKVQRDSDPEHPTQKPVALAQRAIDNSSQPGDIVYDGFLGSGSTLMAAEFSGRRCFGMELEPRYCDQTIRRWEEFTGEKAQKQ